MKCHIRRLENSFVVASHLQDRHLYSKMYTQ
jgi:hypothetical protein